jgi:PPK2 family polyphosphate:nucleotide phosphotransferase
MLPAQILKKFRITNPKMLRRLGDYDPADTCGLEKDAAKDMLAAAKKRLGELQERLYAEDRWAVLAILQAMDAAGKDGVIDHVMSGINPLGCEVHSFKAPSADELDHDFMWRTSKVLPPRGRIGIFNRSYYEEVLVVRVHPEILQRQKLPRGLISEDIWQQRFEDIRDFERYIARNGIKPIKFFLYISKEEQRQRFLDRIEEPAKRWKFSLGDVEERKLWDRYMAAYEDAIGNTATAHAPWYVIPGDKKWFGRLVVAAALVEALEAIDPQVPKLDAKATGELRKVRAALEAERPAPKATGIR